MWKSIGNDYWENLLPVREKAAPERTYPVGSCQIRTSQQSLFEAAE